MKLRQLKRDEALIQIQPWGRDGKRIYASVKDLGQVNVTRFMSEKEWLTEHGRGGEHPTIMGLLQEALQRMADKLQKFEQK